MITLSISQRGQRADENLSRGRGRSGEKRRRKNDYSARHASRHLAQRLGEREKKKKKEEEEEKLQHSPRGHTPRTTTRGKKIKNKK